jgi:glutamate N-acetyltransferase/amino-acid N-acetyltransferase
MRDAKEMVRLAEDALAAPRNSFLVASTGRIGVQLPMDRLEKGINEACSSVSEDPEQGLNAANAILTSDTKPKICTVRFEHDGDEITVSGIAKGAGMIEPNMATMLAFIVTDIKTSNAILQNVLKEAVDQSFNSLTIDGDMSTNDTVLLLANGSSQVVLRESDEKLMKKFKHAVTYVSRDLGSKIVGDGEKITHVIELLVSGAKDRASAEKVARSIGNSLLVKTSWYGNDPNWGRLVDAAGYAKVGIEEHKLDISYEEVPVLIDGTPVFENKPLWKEVVSRKKFSILINLNQGDEEYTLLTTDLSEEYVNFNRSE